MLPHSMEKVKWAGSSIMSEKAEPLKVSRPLLSLTMIGIILFVLFTSLSLSFFTTVSDVQVSATTMELLPDPLNYSAYQIQAPGSATLTLSYLFPETSGWGMLNMTPSWGNLSATKDGLLYTGCEFINTSKEFIITNVTGEGSYDSSLIPVNDCGVYIFPAKSEITYNPSLYTTVTFTISVVDSATQGDYVLFPAGGHCGYSIFLIVGESMPSQLPSLTFLQCPKGNARTDASISVVAVQDLTGFNIPY